ncbi:uncharacterized protein [Rutidosis leptorrhynchoides]|uniref:uncharacterized protein n=1 Tax=Rutidosis leptorrhynchoides TaxID=125765 RepID=UPI003A9947DE
MILVRDYPSNQKRILFFTEGPTSFNMKVVGASYGEKLKEQGIAVDVVNLYLDEGKGSYWMKGLDAFVAAANNNNNSHIIHVQSGIWTLTTDVLSSTPEIVSGALLEEEEKRCLEANKPPNPSDEYAEEKILHLEKLIVDSFEKQGLKPPIIQLNNNNNNSGFKARGVERGKRNLFLLQLSNIFNKVRGVERRQNNRLQKLEDRKRFEAMGGEFGGHNYYLEQLNNNRFKAQSGKHNRLWRPWLSCLPS